MRAVANPHPLAGAGNWVPASGGTEQPFLTRTGRRLQYVWQPRTGAHAYYDLDRDLILSDEEARRALGTFNDNPRRPAREKFEAAQQTYREASQTKDQFEISLWSKYGPRNVQYASSAELRKLQQLRGRQERACDRVFRMVQDAPREWGRGVPLHWICGKLSYDDAFRPTSEPLSVTPPLAYGATEPMRENPRRPPKAWFDRCVRGVERSGGAYDARAVCGAQWQRKSEAEKRRLSRGRDESLQENPIGGAATALIVGGVAALAYFLFLKPAKAAPKTSLTACAIDRMKLDRWGNARGFRVYYYSNETSTRFQNVLDALLPLLSDLPAGEQAVIVLGDGSFWYYLEGQSGRADNLRADYCSFPDVAPPQIQPPPPSGTTQGLLGQAPNLPPENTWTHSARQFYYWSSFTREWVFIAEDVAPGTFALGVGGGDLHTQMCDFFPDVDCGKYIRYWIAQVQWIYVSPPSTSAGWYFYDSEIESGGISPGASGR